MRYPRLFPGTALTLSALSLFALPAIAAEPGTYRPGAPYYSTHAASADICERQCSGDAQCKGWNFVAINRRAEKGVCEFNSTDAAPVPSEISTSGSNGVPSYSRRLAAGGTSTVRVGSPEPVRRSAPSPRSNIIAVRTAPLAKPSARTDLSAVRPGARAIRPGQKTPPRRIVREAIPQRIQPEHSAYRAPARATAAPAMPKPPQRPRFQHNLDPGVPQGYVPRRAPQNARPQAPAPAPRLQGGDPRLQNMVRQHAAQPARPAPTSRPQAQAPQAQPQVAPQRPQTLAQAEQSLFGSLHDDVKTPKPITEAEENNPDAPIATVTAVPIKKVTTDNLLGLAGAPSR